MAVGGPHQVEELVLLDGRRVVGREPRPQELELLVAEPAVLDRTVGAQHHLEVLLRDLVGLLRVAELEGQQRGG